MVIIRWINKNQSLNQIKQIKQTHCALILTVNFIFMVVLTESFHRCETNLAACKRCFFSSLSQKPPLSYLHRNWMSCYILTQAPTGIRSWFTWFGRTPIGAKEMIVCNVQVERLRISVFFISRWCTIFDRNLLSKRWFTLTSTFRSVLTNRARGKQTRLTWCVCICAREVLVFFSSFCTMSAAHLWT